MISTAPGTSLYTDKTTTRSSEGFLRCCGPFYIRLPSHTSCPARRRTISRPARQSTVRRRTISRPARQSTVRRRTISRPARQSTVRRRTISRPARHSTTCHPPQRRPGSPPCPRLSILPSLPGDPPHQQLKSIPSPSTDTPCPRLNILPSLPGDSPPFAGTLCLQQQRIGY